MQTQVVLPLVLKINKKSSVQKQEEKYLPEDFCPLKQRTRGVYGWLTEYFPETSAKKRRELALRFGQEMRMWADRGYQFAIKEEAKDMFNLLDFSSIKLERGE